MEALEAAKAGLGKSELFAQYECVLAVADVSFSVEAGEIFCVMGLSGSGKSTLVRHINRLIDPTEGEILIDGDDIGRKMPDQLRELRATKIGMVFQNMALFPHRTVRENVAFGLEIRGVGKELRDEVADEKLELVQLAGWGDRLPNELSGGMQQRVGLARALAVDPDILLMDEPFSALDPLIRRQLQDQFIELSNQVRKTTIFITHDLDEANRLGHRIGIMKDGRLVQIGTSEEIAATPRNDYVAEFVAGVSRLRMIRARSVMEPADAHPSLCDPSENWPVIRADAGLKELVQLAVQQDKPLLVLDDRHAPIGVVTRRSLLKAIMQYERH